MTPPNQQTDQELLSLIKEDGRAAFNTIYSKYWPELYNTAYKRNHNKQLCQDLVQNGHLVLPDGMSYSLLVLPKLATMRPELLQKIKELVKQGAHISGPPPSSSPSLENYSQADRKVATIAKELWGSGKMMQNNNLQQTLTAIGIEPDFNVKDSSVLFIHRTMPGVEIYYLSNQTEKNIAISPSFKVSGKQPGVWDPVTGEIRRLYQYVEQRGRISIPLKLAPLQSLFVVFKKVTGVLTGSARVSKFPDLMTISTISTPWTVDFDVKMRGPADPVIFNELKDWTKRPEKEIKYYAGTAVYHNTFTINKSLPNGRSYLDVGELNGMARVKINGVDVGGIWTAPWHVEITKALKTGINTVEIAVVNNWMNRIIGDSMLPVEERKTTLNYNLYEPGSQLQQSGLTGPVKIEIE